MQRAGRINNKFHKYSSIMKGKIELLPLLPSKTECPGKYAIPVTVRTAAFTSERIFIDFLCQASIILSNFKRKQKLKVSYLFFKCSVQFLQVYVKEEHQ